MTVLTLEPSYDEQFATEDPREPQGSTVVVGEEQALGLPVYLVLGLVSSLQVIGHHHMPALCSQHLPLTTSD